jgi:hypothetical protein
MEDLPPRIRLARSIFARTITTGTDFLDAEIVFLQFRKMLEQIAFASLAANRKAYSAARAKFATEWRAKTMLEYLEQVNAEFYPQPLRVAAVTPHPEAARQFKLEPLMDGFLTKDDFVELYDYCGDILHARNPYGGGGRVINVRLPAQEWLSRIEKLVGLHQARLLTGGCWIGAVPDKDGRVHTYTADPVPSEDEGLGDGGGQSGSDLRG